MKRLKHMAGQFRTALLALVVVLLILLCAIMVVGCTSDADDDDAMPSLTAIFAEALTDHQGRITALRDDNGCLLTITNLDTTTVSRNTPDSIYRVKAWIAPDGTDGRVRVAQLEWIYSYIPQRPAGTIVKHDPVEAVSATITPRYINMRLAVRCSKIGAQRFAFIEESILPNTEGTKTLTISLHHDTNGDSPNYTQDLLFSCPIYQYVETLTPGRDKIRLVVHTKDQPFTQEWDFPATR